MPKDSSSGHYEAKESLLRDRIDMTFVNICFGAHLVASQPFRDASVL